jgi:hypothetical protein
MTMVKQYLVSIGELAHLGIGCPKCKTRILFDCTDPEARIPEECPGCQAGQDDTFRNAVRTYREVARTRVSAAPRFLTS